jgi:hypothetical protein
MNGFTLIAHLTSHWLKYTVAHLPVAFVLDVGGRSILCRMTEIESNDKGTVVRLERVEA